MLTQASRQRVFIAIRSNRGLRVAGMGWRRMLRRGPRESRLARNRTALPPAPMRPVATAVASKA